MHAPINVSFGIEFEMVVLYNVKDYEAELKSAEAVHWLSSDPIDLRQKVLHLIQIQMIQVLIDHGIPTNKWGRAQDFTKWTVEHDGTVSWQDSGLQDWCAIELKTPAFLFDPWALDQVGKALFLVKKHFTAVTNDSCGLHIHVGNCHEGYPLRTLKNFAMLITSFERQFSSLHSFDRINNHYVRPLTDNFSVVMSVWDKLLKIESCRSVEEVINTFNYDNNKWTAYCFLTLLNPSLRTVEFRQHSGTLDNDTITHWAKLSTNMISLAHSASHSGFYDIIKAHAHEENYNIINLLTDLNLPELAEYYSQPPREIYNHPARWSEEWELQSKAQPSSRQLDDPAEPPAYEEGPPSWKTDRGQEFWKDESASWGVDLAAPALIETGLEPCNNLYQRQIEVW